MALLALIIQLGLSFGHVHVPHTDRPALALADIESTSTPPPTDSDDSTFHYCAICAVLAQMAGAQTETAPEISALTALASASIEAGGETPLRTSYSASFRSRAPPQH